MNKIQAILAARKAYLDNRPQLPFLDNIAGVGPEGDVYFLNTTIKSDQIPALIEWLRTNFVEDV